MSWADNRERLELCRDMWNAGGMSAADIAERLGLGADQRNAVISAARRHRHKVDPPFMVKSGKSISKTRKSTKRKNPKPSAQHQNGADGAPAAADGQARRNPPFRKPAEPAAAPTVGVLYQHLLRDRRSGITGDRCLWRVNPHWETRVMCCGAGTPPGKAFCGTHAEAARR